MALTVTFIEDAVELPTKGTLGDRLVQAPFSFNLGNTYATNGIAITTADLNGVLSLDSFNGIESIEFSTEKTGLGTFSFDAAAQKIKALNMSGVEFLNGTDLSALNIVGVARGPAIPY